MNKLSLWCLGLLHRWEKLKGQLLCDIKMVLHSTPCKSNGFFCGYAQPNADSDWSACRYSENTCMCVFVYRSVLYEYLSMSGRSYVGLRNFTYYLFPYPRHDKTPLKKMAAWPWPWPCLLSSRPVCPWGVTSSLPLLISTAGTKMKISSSSY